MTETASRFVCLSGASTNHDDHSIIELYAQYLHSSPKDLASPLLVTLEESQFEAIRDCRGDFNHDLCAML